MYGGMATQAIKLLSPTNSHVIQAVTHHTCTEKQYLSALRNILPLAGLATPEGLYMARTSSYCTATRLRIASTAFKQSPQHSSPPPANWLSFQDWK